MKHLTILIPAGDNNLSSITGSYEIFTRANEYWKEQHGGELFKLCLAGVSDSIGFSKGLFEVKPHRHIAAISKTDLIIIPSLNHQYVSSVAANQPLIDWVVKQYRRGAEVASICTGTFLLAATGLLDGMACSTHWAAADNFRSMFPNVHIQADKLITDEKGLYTNGGAYSFLNLIIYLVEKYYDRRTAIWCAKIFQVEMDRGSQSAFAIFAGQKQHDDVVVQQAQAFLENNPDEKISIEHLSSMFATGRRNFDRRFMKATGNTPIEYAQRVKIEFAKKSLETSSKHINEVMYDVGYADVKAFREVFRKITGMSPLEYRRRYNKEAAL